jgi:hypothetical protein
MAIAFPSNPSGTQAIDLGQDGTPTVLINVTGGTLCIWATHRSLPTGPPGTSFNLGAYSRGFPTNGNSNNARLEIETEVGAHIHGLASTTDGGSTVFATGPDNQIVIDKPQHLAVVCDWQNQYVAVYVDGDLAASNGSASFIANFSSSLPPRSGAIGTEEDLVTTTENFPGMVEDFRVYNVALTPDEIKTIAGCRGTDGIVRNLRIRYEFLDQPTGTVAATGTVRDFGPLQSQTSGSNSPTYNGSLTTKYRRRLP